MPGRLVLLGHPVSHSLSPAFQNAALAARRIALHYEALDVAPQALGSVLDALVAERAAGNVTIPHKEAVLARCDRLTPLARRVGAVNTFRVEDGALVGDNTDVDGFDALVESVHGIDPSRVALVGAGGAASAVLAALERRRASRVCVWNRSAERAHMLAERFASIATPHDALVDALVDATLVVNATPLGRTGEPWPVALPDMPEDADALDLAYAPGRTAWVRALRDAGRIAEDGREMLLEQGARAFERWFGVAPDRDLMRRALDEAARA